MSVTGLTTSLDTKTFKGLLRRYQVVGDSIAVGVSGGADSMALTLLLKEWCQEKDVKLVALTIDHGLREDSADEATRVAGWMKEHNIVHHIIPLSEPIKTDASIPARARDARYNMLWNWCESNNVKTLAVGHHADDQMETFLMRLISGSGIKGLLAMEPMVQRDNGTVLLRPLLSVTKEVLVATLKEHKQEWIEDPSNDNATHTRNRLRKTIIPLLHEEGLSTERMSNVIQKLHATYEVLESSVNAWLAGYVKLFDAGYVTTPHEAWQDPYLPREIHKQALSTLLQTVSGNQGYPPRDSTLVPELYITREWKRVNTTKAHEGLTLWDKRFAFKAVLGGANDINIKPLGEEGVKQLIMNDFVLPALPLQVLYGFVSMWRVETLLCVPHIEYGQVALMSELEFISKTTPR